MVKNNGGGRVNVAVRDIESNAAVVGGIWIMIDMAIKTSKAGRLKGMLYRTKQDIYQTRMQIRLIGSDEE